MKAVTLDMWNSLYCLYWRCRPFNSMFFILLSCIVLCIFIKERACFWRPTKKKTLIFSSMTWWQKKKTKAFASYSLCCFLIYWSYNRSPVFSTLRYFLISQYWKPKGEVIIDHVLIIMAIKIIIDELIIIIFRLYIWNCEQN